MNGENRTKCNRERQEKNRSCGIHFRSSRAQHTTLRQSIMRGDMDKQGKIYGEMQRRKCWNNKRVSLGLSWTLTHSLFSSMEKNESMQNQFQGSQYDGVK